MFAVVSLGRDTGKGKTQLKVSTYTTIYIFFPYEYSTSCLGSERATA